MPSTVTVPVPGIRYCSLQYLVIVPIARPTCFLYYWYLTKEIRYKRPFFMAIYGTYICTACKKEMQMYVCIIIFVIVYFCSIPSSLFINNRFSFSRFEILHFSPLWFYAGSKLQMQISPLPLPAWHRYCLYLCTVQYCILYVCLYWFYRIRHYWEV